ncbi:hypothetical protein DM860_005195 [Cuscuta australis]|uniref:Uncharacterized protein n=1 Tax=Cuscuta australis TaxID=267555 RepID=A0A328DN67_9ASTE|nr:hypothetical protein DM860_005195 [Cuscuta australis]
MRRLPSSTPDAPMPRLAGPEMPSHIEKYTISVHPILHGSILPTQLLSALHLDWMRDSFDSVFIQLLTPPPPPPPPPTPLPPSLCHSFIFLSASKVRLIVSLIPARHFVCLFVLHVALPTLATWI